MEFLHKLQPHMRKLWQPVAGLWKRIHNWLWPELPPGVYTISDENYEMLERLTENTWQTPEELASELLNETFRNHAAQAENWRLWNTLSPREKEVAALICLGLTGRQIAARLVLSPNTVRTHCDHILNKFGIPNRMTLRALLVDWDFTGWE